MKEKKIKLIDNSVYSIVLEDQDLLNHFETSNNYIVVYKAKYLYQSAF